MSVALTRSRMLFSMAQMHTTSLPLTRGDMVAHAGRQSDRGHTKAPGPVLRAGSGEDLLPKGGGSTRTAIVERASGAHSVLSLSRRAAGFQGWAERPRE